MNGPTNPLYVFDTNAIIAALNDKNIVLQAGGRFISVITEMELLAKPGISPEAVREIRGFLKTIPVIPLSGEIKWEAIRVRRDGTPRLKLPDAIVAATAVILQAQLVTVDKRIRALAWPGFSALPPLP
jgi:predicted nucleic acid-binding protein